MDDKRFDDLVRKKAEAYTDTAQDPHALSDLRKRLSNVSENINGSRWSPGKAGYALGALVLFTLLNVGVVWYFSEARHQELTRELGTLKDQRNQLISMQGDIEEIRSVKSDTIYVYRDVLVEQSSSSFGTASQPGTGTNTSSSALFTGEFQENTDHQFFHNVPDNYQLSNELKSFLTENKLLLVTDQGELMLVVNSPEVQPLYATGTRKNQISGPRLPQNLTEVATYDMVTKKDIPVEKKKLPNHLIWALEKHDHHGIDWQFGLEAIYHKSNFDVGEGDKNGGVGLMAEAILSPKWRIATGFNVGARSYRIKEPEIKELPADFFNDYPGYDESTGELTGVESDAKLLKIPINLKYFNILDHNKLWYISAGFTPQWALTQEMDYRYALEIDNPPVGDTEFVSYIGSKQEVHSAYYTTTLDLGVGTEVYLNQNLRWQLGLFYQKGLSKAGAENRELTNSYGIKTSLWFNKP